MDNRTLVIIIQVYRILCGLMGILAGLSLAMLVLSVGSEWRVGVAWFVVVLTFAIAASSSHKHAEYLNKK
jgi:hypothetical protein